jgi:hypothetical protein
MTQGAGVAVLQCRPLAAHHCARDGRRLSLLTVNGTVVGLFDGVTYDESTVVMQPGDIFVAYSDGVTEPENEFGEFGEDRLIALIQEHRKSLCRALPRSSPAQSRTGSAARNSRTM